MPSQQPKPGKKKNKKDQDKDGRQMTILDDYTAKLARLDPDAFIGRLVWFTIAGVDEREDGQRTYTPVRATREQLETWFDELDLDKGFLPKPIARVNAFRAASSEAKREYPGAERGQTVNLRVVEIDKNEEWVLRHVLRDVHDTRTQTTTTSHVATLKFFKSAKGKEYIKTSINSNLVELRLDQKPSGNKYPLGEVDRAEIESLLADFTDRYEDLSLRLGANAVRAIVRDYVSSLNAIMVKPSGGIYFVHNTRIETCDKLQQLVRRIGQGCRFSQVPLLDEPEQREMLTDAFQSNVQDAVTSLLTDIAKANEEAKTKTGGLMPISAYTAFTNRFAELMQRSEEYTNLLGLAQGRASIALETAMDVIGEMAGRLDAGPATTRRKRS